MPQSIAQVDAFTDRVFAGNPAAVCILSGPKDETWMQNVAAEMNLAETAFLYPTGNGYSLRWFTPVAEVALCGHATLASAHLIWEDNLAPAESILRFHTKSGELTAVKRGDWIELNFPARPVSPVEPPDGLLAVLGLKDPVYVGKSTYDYFIEVDSEEIVRSLAPDFGRLRELPVRGAIVTARGRAPYDIVSRFFAPGVGIDEDPVTGSAHCSLGPYWRAKLGQENFLAYQASKRGGVIRVGVRGDRILLGGQAVTVLTGRLRD